MYSVVTEPIACRSKLPSTGKMIKTTAVAKYELGTYLGTQFLDLVLTKRGGTSEDSFLPITTEVPRELLITF